MTTVAGLSIALLLSSGCSSSTHALEPSAGGRASLGAGGTEGGAPSGAPMGGDGTIGGNGGGASGSATLASGGAPASGGQPTGTGLGGAAATAGGNTAGAAAMAGGNAAGAAAGAAGGNVAAGGAQAGTGAAGASDEPFVLAWQDDFDELDTAAWQLQTFTYDGNEAQFSTQNASVSNGVLTLSLTPAPSGADKPYLGVEMRSAKTLTYGKVSARMRFATGSGVVSGLVRFLTPYPNCDWNEIDIEHLGKSSNSSQLNAMVYTGTPDPNCTTSVTPTQDPLVVDLGFNAETDFHLYDVEWTPAGVKYFGDGVLLRTWTANIGLLKLPETILLTIWASSSADWAGALTSTSAPTSADVDWIKVYDYEPSASGM